MSILLSHQRLTQGQDWRKIIVEILMVIQMVLGAIQQIQIKAGIIVMFHSALFLMMDVEKPNMNQFAVLEELLVAVFQIPILGPGRSVSAYVLVISTFVEAH